MTREQREAELKQWAEKDKSRFLGIYKRSAETPHGTTHEEGAPDGRMIKEILDREFPDAAAAS